MMAEFGHHDWTTNHYGKVICTQCGKIITGTPARCPGPRETPAIPDLGADAEYRKPIEPAPETLDETPASLPTDRNRLEDDLAFYRRRIVADRAKVARLEKELTELLG